MTRILLTCAVACAIASSGCVRVRPWEREQHASRAMQPHLGELGLGSKYGAKMLESRTGGGVPGDAPGGGCGCTQ
jgi:hypothetical protein